MTILTVADPSAVPSNDIVIDRVCVADAGAVPEPMTWTPMLAGFGGIGAVLRSQRCRQQFAAV